jgi:hypothetical protein
MDQMKKAFKGLFSKKKAKKEEHPDATPTADKPSSAAPVTEPDVAPTSSAPESAAPQPAPASAPASAPAPAHDGANKDEVAAHAEVKKATQSKSTTPHTTCLLPARLDVLPETLYGHPLQPRQICTC